MYKIEKNIPIRDTRNIEFPFEKMDIGDSFFVECEGEDGLQKNRVKINNSARSFNSALKNMPLWKFTIRKYEKGLRVWRIES